jgi:hypothetical protein
MCPICLEDVPVGTGAVLNCGGEHVLHVACLQDFADVDRPDFFGGPYLPDVINLPCFPVVHSSFPHIL